jgi:short-subunit dehydrogenase
MQAMAKRSLVASRILLTGASSGIGRALALALATSGSRVLAAARRAALLRELAAAAVGPGQIEIAAGDVTEAAFRAELVRLAQQRLGGLDILINNAGAGALGLFEYADPARLRVVMEVNFFAAAELIRNTLPLLRQGNNPLIVNVGSVLGHRAIPTMAEYCASKFALRGLSESLRAEFARLGIDLLLVSPGSTESQFYDNLVESKGEVLWPGRPRRTAQRVAGDIVRAMRRGRREIIPSHSGRLLVWANRVFPGIVDRVLARRTF